MKHAIVLGASGGIGYALTMKLASKGVKVTAFARDEKKLKRLFMNQPNISIHSGDMLNEEDIRAVVKKQAVLFHAINFPYSIWDKAHMEGVQTLIKVAKHTDAKVVLADNIYAYGEQEKPVAEDGVKKPHTRKGKIRLEMEKELLKSEVPALIAHLPDLYGPNATNTLIHETLRSAVKGKKANYIGSPELSREFLYTIDGAQQMVELAMKEENFNQNWNIPGQLISGNELLNIIKEVTNTKKGFRIVNRRMIQFLGLFSSQMKEIVEMMYLNERPVHLDGEKVISELRRIQRTSFKAGLKETVSWMKEMNDNQ